MDAKIAIIGIIVEKRESSEQLNKLLSEYGDYIIGRMGIPHQKLGVNVIGIVINAARETIDSLSEKIEGIEGVSANTTYSKI